MSFDGENLERLSGLKLQLPCFICQKSEVSDEELKGATKVSDAVALVKKEFNEYVFLYACLVRHNHGNVRFPVSPFG